MDEKFTLVKTEDLNGRIFKFYEGYGYEVRASYIKNDPFSWTIRIKPVKYKNAFHFNYEIDCLSKECFQIENAPISALPVREDEIDDVIAGFQNVKAMMTEVKNRWDEFFDIMEDTENAPEDL